MLQGLFVGSVVQGRARPQPFSHSTFDGLKRLDTPGIPAWQDRGARRPPPQPLPRCKDAPPPHHHPMLPSARSERGAPAKAPMRREWPADYWDELLTLRGLPERCRRTAQQ